MALGRLGGKKGGKSKMEKEIAFSQKSSYINSTLFEGDIFYLKSVIMYLVNINEVF